MQNARLKAAATKTNYVSWRGHHRSATPLHRCGTLILPLFSFVPGFLTRGILGASGEVVYLFIRLPIYRPAISLRVTAFSHAFLLG